jgi:Uma2 family endonuclease
MPVSEATYERLSLEDDEDTWELVCGRLRRKPPMTSEHYQPARRLVRRLNAQLDEEQYTVDKDGPKLRVPGGNYRVPDVCVIPSTLIERRLREQQGQFESFPDAMPLVVEIWSPSTGETDITEKLLEYQRRGDLEIWYIHPYERTLTVWRRRPDGGYDMTAYTGGVVPVVALPGVSIDLASLFG